MAIVRLMTAHMLLLLRFAANFESYAPRCIASVRLFVSRLLLCSFESFSEDDRAPQMLATVFRIVAICAVVLLLAV